MDICCQWSHVCFYVKCHGVCQVIPAAQEGDNYYCDNTCLDRRNHDLEEGTEHTAAVNSGSIIQGCGTLLK